MSDHDGRSDEELKRANRVEACKTYLEQTKLLVTLASAFIVAPAAVVALQPANRNALVAFTMEIIVAEIFLVASVLAGYFVLGSIAGSQHRGTFDVYRPATRLSSLFQLAAYLIGLLFIVSVVVGVIRTATC